MLALYSDRAGDVQLAYIVAVVVVYLMWKLLVR